MRWSSALSVGNASIDDQHQRLFQLLDHIEQSSPENGNAEVRLAVETLQRYAIEHLRDEEALLRAIHYEDYDIHCEQHRFFEEKLQSLIDRLTAENTAEILNELHDFVRTWIFNHVSFADQLYKPYLPK